MIPWTVSTSSCLRLRRYQTILLSLVTPVGTLGSFDEYLQGLTVCCLIPGLQSPSHLLLDGGDGHTSNDDSHGDMRPLIGASQHDNVDEHQFPDVGPDHDSSELPQESGKANSDTTGSISESETEMDVVDFAHEPSPQSSAVVLKGKIPAGTYHSVTCTPDQFPNVLRPRRPTKLCIAVTM